MPEIVESGQTEHNECHHTKLSGVRDIHQADVSSSPDSTTKFGISQVDTQLAEFIQKTLSDPNRLIYQDW